MPAIHVGEIPLMDDLGLGRMIHEVISRATWYSIQGYIPGRIALVFHVAVIFSFTMLVCSMNDHYLCVYPCHIHRQREADHLNEVSSVMNALSL